MGTIVDIDRLETYDKNGVLPIVKGNTNLIKDTVGWTGKNLIPYPYVDISRTLYGITYTVNTDGSITVNGTATNLTTFNIAKISDFDGDYILSGGVSLETNEVGLILRKGDFAGATVGTDVTGKGFKFNSSLVDGVGCIQLRFTSGTTVNNLTFYPMLRKADIVDDTYEPYHETVDGIFDTFIGNSNVTASIMPAYIAKNLPILKRDITDAYYNGNLKTEIAAGNFKNVRVGDYIKGKTTGTIYYVVDMDYWWHIGDKTNATDNPAGYKHHLTIMPFKLTGSMVGLWSGYGYSDKSWRVSANDKGRCPWNAATDVDHTSTEAIGTNSTNITRNGVSGYLGSYIKTYALQRYYDEWLVPDFGEDSVLKFRTWLGNAINTDAISGAEGSWKGITSGAAWVDSYCDLPSEPNLYGGKVASSSYRDIGCQKSRLALFDQAAIIDFYDRMDIWTKAVASTSDACYANYFGNASTFGASLAAWVCPLANVN